MNFMDLIKKSFSNSWTGGASIDPRTGKLGDPNRFHGPGAFDNFKMADIFDNDRWTREKIGDPNPKSDRQQYTSYYSPRDITETVTEDDSGRKKTIVSKYKGVGEAYGRPMGNYENHPTRYPIGQDAYAEEGPGMGSFAPWSDRAGQRQPMQGPPFDNSGRYEPRSDSAWSRPPMQGGPPLPNTPPPGWAPPFDTSGRYEPLSDSRWSRPPMQGPRQLPNTPPPGLVPRQSNTTYEPNPGDDSNWRAFPGKFSMPPAYPGQQNLPPISRAQQYMPPTELFNAGTRENVEGKLLARMLDPAYGERIPEGIKRKMIELMLKRSD